MLEVGGFELRVYGLLIGLGVLAGAWVVARMALRECLDPKKVEDGLVWVVIPGVVGARLYHVIDLWEYYSHRLGEVVAVWRGGLGIYGAIIGGVLGLVWYLRKQGVSRAEAGKWIDVASFGLPVGQAIGRWGNFFNQEVYGRPTDLPWGVWIDEQWRVKGYQQFERFQPLFLYESLLSLGLFGIMVWLYCQPKWKKGKYWCGTDPKLTPGRGGYLGTYLMGYGLIRFILEPMRLESWMWQGIAVARIMAIGMILAGLILVSLRKKKHG